MERYDLVKRHLELALGDLAVLAGTIVGDAPWQDVAKTAAINLRTLADLLENVHTDRWRLRHLEGSVVFPCPLEVLEEIINNDGE